MTVESAAPSSPAIEARSVLSDELIQACGERAAVYDRENRFFYRGLRGASSRRLPERVGAAGPIK